MLNSLEQSSPVWCLLVMFHSVYYYFFLWHEVDWYFMSTQHELTASLNALKLGAIDRSWHLYERLLNEITRKVGSHTYDCSRPTPLRSQAVASLWTGLDRYPLALGVCDQSMLRWVETASKRCNTKISKPNCKVQMYFGAPLTATVN